MRSRSWLDNIEVKTLFHKSDEETYTCAMWIVAGAIAVGRCDVSMDGSLAIAEDDGGWGAGIESSSSLKAVLTWLFLRAPCLRVESVFLNDNGYRSAAHAVPGSKLMHLLRELPDHDGKYMLVFTRHEIKFLLMDTIQKGTWKHEARVKTLCKPYIKLSMNAPR